MSVAFLESKGQYRVLVTMKGKEGDNLQSQRWWSWRLFRQERRQHSAPRRQHECDIPVHNSVSLHTLIMSVLVVMS